MSRYRSAGLFLALAALWGVAFMAIRVGLEYFPPVLFAALRYDVAGVVMLGYAAWRVEEVRPRGRQWLLVAAGGALMIAAYHAFLFVGEQDAKSAVAAVIVGLSPILTAGFARALLPEERLSVAGVVGLVLGLAGVVVLAEPDPGNLLGGGVVAKLLIFLAAASFALGSVLTKWIDAELPVETMQAWSMLVGAALMHLVSLWPLGESPAAIEWTAEAVGALAFLAIGASAVGFLIYFTLLERLGPTEINLVSYVAPVFAAVSAYLWRGVGVDLATVAGFLCILAGFVLIKRRALRTELDWLLAGRPGGPGDPDHDLEDSQ